MTHHLKIAAMIAATLIIYAVVRKLYMRYNHPLLNIVVLSAVIVGAGLVALGMSFNDYIPAKNIMTLLLGPATVGLAVPLYRYRKLLLTYGVAIIASVVLGSVTAMLSAAITVKLCGLPRDVVISILPKGVSIPFAVEIARMYGGVPELSIAFVVATGTLGTLCGRQTLDLFRITHPVARGLALGTVSHAQGTAAALMEGQQQGAMAGLAMILAGIFTVGLAPLVVRLLGMV